MGVVTGFKVHRLQIEKETMVGGKGGVLGQVYLEGMRRKKKEKAIEGAEGNYGSKCLQRTLGNDEKKKKKFISGGPNQKRRRTESLSKDPGG